MTAELQTFGRRPWSRAEDRIIREQYMTARLGQRAKSCLEALPGRTKEAMKSRAKHLKRPRTVQQSVVCFMDGIDWQHHLEDDPDGTRLYPSESSLVAGTKHSLDECGIVEVEVRLVRWVKPQDLGI